MSKNSPRSVVSRSQRRIAGPNTEIERYLKTGDHDPGFAAWEGDTVARELCAHDELLRALVQEVKRRSAACGPPTTLDDVDTVQLTRSKVEPMIRGLFRRTEHNTVLGVVESSVVFLTQSNIELILLESDWLSTAWDLANLYLNSIGADLLGDDAPSLVGLSEETMCYVSPEYFEETDPFADFIVHEVAHIFHNTKRSTIGLSETRRREWLLDIEFRKRETFAYACEAYARILESSTSLRDRAERAKEYASHPRFLDERADSSEVADILGDASGRRNGWKTILKRCAPVR